MRYKDWKEHLASQIDDRSTYTLRQLADKAQKDTPTVKRALGYFDFPSERDESDFRRPKVIRGIYVRVVLVGLAPYVAAWARAKDAQDPDALERAERNLYEAAKVRRKD